MAINVIEQLASSLGRRDEVPNQELAAAIVKSKDEKAVSELIGLLEHKSNKIQNDVIKVIYEIGAVQPAMIAIHARKFFELLSHKNNRLQWGGMTAISAITTTKPALIYKGLPQILDAAEDGSVVTKDQAANILIQLAAIPAYAEEAFSLLSEFILKSASNQFPMYAERTLPVITRENVTSFTKILRSRLPGIEKESQKKRIEKILKQLKEGRMQE